MGIVGIGIDIVKIARIRGVLQRQGNKFIKKIFHIKEIENQPTNSDLHAQYYASRWAVKEATWKALGKRVNHAYVINDPKSRKPSLILEEEALTRAKKMANGDVKTHVSISHEEDYVTAMVIIES